MFQDNNSDKESEYEYTSPQSSPNITKKCFSTTDNPNWKPLALRATQSFTGVMEELRICGNMQKVNLGNRVTVVATPEPTAVCPCGCHLRPATVNPFRTREQTSLALHVVSPEVLMHHGYNYDPSQIAMFWKKDCRMFLWKGNSKTKNIIVEHSRMK